MSATETAGVRLALLRAMAAEMNLWMGDFAQTAYAVSRALLDGALTVDVITEYPPAGEYPQALSRDIARTVGLPFVDDDDVDGSSGGLCSIGAEAVGVGIEALRAIPLGEAGIREGTWCFFAETLHRHGLTIDEVRDHMRGLGLMEAAQLIVDAVAVPIEHTR